MATVADVVQALQDVLGAAADEAARTTGFVRRRSKLSGAAFVQALVFGWWSNPQASREELAQTAALRGSPVSAQAIDQRLSEGAACCLAAVLGQAAATLLSADPVAVPLLQRFSAVVVQDSSSIVLPPASAQTWPGCGKGAALKLQLRLELAVGALAGPVLQPGRCHDAVAVPGLPPLRTGGLWLGDLGFFNLEQFACWTRSGCYWLSRLKAGVLLCEPATGRRLELRALLAARSADQLDRPVQLGERQRLPCRLLAVRLPTEVAVARRRELRAEARRRGQAPRAQRLLLADWTLLVTNVPAEQLSLTQALVLYRARWQIELLFKLWKGDGQLARWRSSKPWVVLCELYAKPLALLCQHWSLLVACWWRAERSLTKAAQTLRKLVWALARVWDDTEQACAVLTDLQRCLAYGGRINKRRAAPHTYPLLLDPTRGFLS